jgi:hypothetical protein
MVRKADRYALTGGAGASSRTSVIVFSAAQPHRLGVLKAALDAFVAEEQALGDVGLNGLLRAFKTASTHIELRQAFAC